VFICKFSLVPNFHDIPIWEPCHESLESNRHQIRTYAFQAFAAHIASHLASRSLDLFTYVSASPLVSYLSISSCNLVHSSFNSAIIYPKNLSLAAVNGWGVILAYVSVRSPTENSFSIFTETSTGNTHSNFTSL
jgi:hypothetical protein